MPKSDDWECLGCQEPNIAGTNRCRNCDLPKGYQPDPKER